MNDLATIKQKFSDSPIKKQLQLIDEINQYGEEGEEYLKEYLASLIETKPNQVAGKIFQVLNNSENALVKNFLQDKFSQGLVTLKSEKNVDYQELQNLLINKEYQSADALTRVKLCELAGKQALERKWVYFTEVEKFPIVDLQTIDLLWFVYSEGKFAYSIQRKLWLSLGKDYPALWVKLKWKDGNKWTKYPQEFIWDLTAPVGHLPLSNQLRGVRVIDALFSHPTWQQ